MELKRIKLRKESMITKEQAILDGIQKSQERIECEFKQSVAQQLEAIARAEQIVRNAQETLEKEKKILLEMEAPTMPEFAGLR